jgi:hypothetical protein
MSEQAATCMPYASYGNAGPGLSGTNQLFLGTEVDVSQFLGIRDPENSDDCRSLCTTNPAKGAFFQMQIQSMDGTTLSVTFTVFQTFEVIFTGLVPTYDS